MRAREFMTVLAGLLDKRLQMDVCAKLVIEADHLKLDHQVTNEMLARAVMYAVVDGVSSESLHRVMPVRPLVSILSIVRYMERMIMYLGFPVELQQESDVSQTRALVARALFLGVLHHVELLDQGKVHNTIVLDIHPEFEPFVECVSDGVVMNIPALCRWGSIFVTNPDLASAFGDHLSRTEDARRLQELYRITTAVMNFDRMPSKLDFLRILQAGMQKATGPTRLN